MLYETRRHSVRHLSCSGTIWSPSGNVRSRNCWLVLSTQPMTASAFYSNPM